MSESLGTPADWAEVRAALEGRDRNSYVNINVPVFVLSAILDAADERDRLAAVIARVAHACTEDTEFWEHADGWIAAQRAILAVLKEADHG